MKKQMSWQKLISGKYFWAAIVAQSICTHYSCFENMGWFVTLKKVQIMGYKNLGAKKQGHCYSKREEARLPLLFLSNNDPVLLHPYFWNPYFGSFFLGHKPTHVFKTRIVGADWLGDWVDQKECRVWPFGHAKIMKLIVQKVNIKTRYSFSGKQSWYWWLQFLFPTSN